MDEKENTLLSWLSTKKTYILLLFVLLLVILSGFLLFYFSKEQKKTQRLLRPSSIPTLTEESKTSILPPGLTKANILSPPQVFFETYENKASLPSLPETIKTYTFRTDFSLEEVLSLGQKLGLTQQKVPDDVYVILYNTTEMNNRGVLTFNRKTGEFSFQSWGIHQPQLASSKPQDTPGVLRSDSPGVEETAKSFLSDLGVIDPTVACPITYQRKGLEGVTFVECHRDWSLVGSSILNFVGVLNIPEGKRLADVSLGSVDENTPEDTSIINVSTGNDGKIRPNDFNTVTVAVTSDGRILSVNSNLRQIASTNTLASTELLTPQEALNQFIAHQAQLSLTIPAGAGVVDWNKVYPGNLAQAKKATITDYLLTYLEKPGQATQQALVPMYLIRGLAKLSSGYTVRFTETVPALRNGLSFLYPITGGSVAGLSTALAEERSIKLGTFPLEASPIISVTPSITPLPGEPFFPTPTYVPFTPLPTPTDAPLNSCFYAIYLLTVIDIPGFGKVGVDLNIPNAVHTYYYIPDPSKDAGKTLADVRRAFYDIIAEQFVINIYKGRTTFSEFQQGFITGVPLFDPAALSYVIPKVTSLYQDAEQWNQSSVWVSKPDYFPSQTLVNFAWILARYTGVAGHPQQQQNDCPYLTGVSPIIYLYPQKPTKVTVKLDSHLTYTDPAVKNNSWQVTAYPDGRIGSDLISTEGLTLNFFSRLYYEYDKNKVSFSESKEGFVVEKRRWEEFVRSKLAPQLGLTERETDDLVADVKNALINLKESPYLKVSFVDREELEDKLPVEIFPVPDTFYRLHLLLLSLNEYQQIPEPTTTPFVRDGFTVIELGATLQE